MEDSVEENEMTKTHEPVSLSLISSFRMGAYCVGMQDLVFGIVSLIAVVNQIVVSNTRLPMFGQYVEDQEGHRWSPPPELAEYYLTQNIVGDPYRMQFVIIALIFAAGGMSLCALLLLLGCRFNRSWLIRIWLFPNYFFLLTHVILMTVIGCFASWAVYALMAGPVLAYRLLLVWLVYVYDQAIALPKPKSLSKIKKKESSLESMSSDSSMDSGLFPELNFESTTPSQVHSSAIQIPQNEVDSGAAFSSDADINWDTIKKESIGNGEYTRYDSFWDSIPEHQNQNIAQNEESNRRRFEDSNSPSYYVADFRTWLDENGSGSKPDMNDDFYSVGGSGSGSSWED